MTIGVPGEPCKCLTRRTWPSFHLRALQASKKYFIFFPRIVQSAHEQVLYIFHQPFLGLVVFTTSFLEQLQNGDRFEGSQRPQRLRVQRRNDPDDTRMW